MIAKSLNVQIVESSTTMITMFRMPGSVTWRKRPTAVAPSTAAASYSSPGIAFMPARKLIPKNGKPRQTLTAITEPMAVPGSLSHPTPLGQDPEDVDQEVVQHARGCSRRSTGS